MPPNSLSAEPQCKHLRDMPDACGQEAGHVYDPFNGRSDAPRGPHTTFFLTRDRSSTKCPLRVHIAGHGSVTGPTLGMGLV